MDSPNGTKATLSRSGVNSPISLSSVLLFPRMSGCKHVIRVSMYGRSSSITMIFLTFEANFLKSSSGNGVVSQGTNDSLMPM